MFFQKTIKIAAQLHNQKVTNSCYRFSQFHLKQNTLKLKSLKALALDLVSREDCSEIEFVMVDDGSQDRTFELLTEASKADKRVKVIRFSRNFGHQAALLAGYEFAKGDVIVSLDSDLQDPPELIKTMLDKIKEGYDVVFAARQSRKNDSWFKRKTAEFFIGL